MNRLSIMRASVVKWNKILDKGGSDGGVLDCPPCRIFYMLVCVGCPIANYSGRKFCRETPYVDWYWHHRTEHDRIRRKIYCPECRRLATAMRDYMIEIVEDLEKKAIRRQGG